MTRALVSALSGLRSHQGWIDVIGNNLANANTPAYKASRAVFSSLIARTIREGTGPSGNLGGTNPVQVGLGAALSYVDRDFSQGSLDITGRTFDLAMLGEGYFTLDDGARTLFTRVGSFGLDAASNVVDLRTGFRVLDRNNQPFSIDTTAVVPPEATQQVGFEGNLPAKVNGPLAEVLESASGYQEGTAATLAGLNGGPFSIPVGETWTMELAMNGGAPQQVSITGTGTGPTATVTTQEVADAINALDNVVATVGAGNVINIASDRTGTDSSIKITPGDAGQDLATTLGLATSLVTGSESTATASSDLNLLTINTADYQTGDVIEVSGTDADGTPIAATFVYGVDGTTLGELQTFLNQQFSSATVSLDSTTGQLRLSADEVGESDLSLVLTDGSGQTGASLFATTSFAVTTNGTGPDTVTSSMEVFDAAGISHILSFTAERQADGSWTLSSSLPESSGTVLNGTVENIQFNENGSLQTPPSASIEVQFAGQSPQTLDLDLGTVGGFEGITQFGDDTSFVAAVQDGYGAGELANLSVTADGTVEGFYTNGESLILGAFGISTFTNPEGLEESGDNYWGESTNSGQRLVGGGQMNGAGEVVGGALEQSNVDTAEEFVRLIQAQRGFQANARIISVQDQLLEEVVNVI
ncbi:MAG: flagellar hook-basal body complex protein [Planctomycetota bacterium]|jgi:flagellar hook protein FlgE